MNPLMRRFLALAMVFGLALPTVAAYAQTSAQPTLGVTVITGGASESFTGIPWHFDGIGYAFGGEGGQVIGLPGGDSIVMHGYMDTDPFVSYSISVTDFGAPSTFSFTFGTPIMTVAGPNLVRASLAGSLTALGGNGAFFAPAGGPLAQLSSLSDGTVTVQVPSVDVGPAFFTGAVANGTYSYPFSQAGYGPLTNGPVSVTGWTYMSTTVNFSLSGGGDGAALVGYFEIIPTPIPEPATYLLMIAGIAAVVFTARPRRPAFPA